MDVLLVPGHASHRNPPTPKHPPQLAHIHPYNARSVADAYQLNRKRKHAVVSVKKNDLGVLNSAVLKLTQTNRSAFAASSVCGNIMLSEDVLSFFFFSGS